MRKARTKGTGQKEVVNERLIKIIFKAVYNYYSVPEELICSKSRKREFTEPRHIIAAMIYSFTHNNQAMTGQRIGGKDHASIVHAIRNTVDLYRTSKPFKLVVDKILSFINFEYGATFAFQQVIDARNGHKLASYNSDTLYDNFNKKIKELMEVEDPFTVLQIHKELLEINGLLWSREVQAEFKERLKAEQDAKEQKTVA